MKIVVAGEWSFDIYEKAMASAFAELGHTVIPFRVAGYFGNVPGNKSGGEHSAIKTNWYKVQYKFIKGPAVYNLNKGFLDLVATEKPDLVFVYRGNYFFPSTIKWVHQNTASRIMVYNNDDPFGASHPSYLWRLLMKGLPFYHHVFAYRQKNIEDYKAIGIDNTSILRSYYRKEENFPINPITDTRFLNEACFIGHFENDGRDEIFKYLLDQNIPLKIYGTLWDRSKHYSFFCEKMGGPIVSLYKDYNLCINSSKISLVLLSTKNNDTYTRRCFEIPATGTFMLSVYTDDLNSLFAEGVEAEYFRNREELLEKINYYLSNKEARNRIAAAGYKRLLNDGHEVVDRAKQVIETYQKILN